MSNQVGDRVKFCGLLWKSELYLNQTNLYELAEIFKGIFWKFLPFKSPSRKNLTVILLLWYKPLRTLCDENGKSMYWHSNLKSCQNDIKKQLAENVHEMFIS